MSPSASDKENTTPPTPEQSQRTRVLASQAAFLAMMGDHRNKEYYDPYQDRAKAREVKRAYRRLHKNVNGTDRSWRVDC
jgi:hypothetical protein